MFLKILKIESTFYITFFILSIIGFWKIFKGGSLYTFFIGLSIFTILVLTIYFTKWFYNNAKIEKKDINTLFILNGFAISTIPNLLSLHDILVDKNKTDWLVPTFSILPLLSVLFFIISYFDTDKNKKILTSFGFAFLNLFFFGFLFFIFLLIFGNIYPELFKF